MIEYLTYAPVASAIFALTILTSLIAFYNEEIYSRFMLQPYDVSRGSRIYTLITSGLIHRDWGHLFFNMLSYFFFAFTLEANYLGHWQFALLYVASLVLSDMPSVVKHKNDIWYRSLGASGAISAVVFSYILYNPLTRMMVFPLPIPIPAILYGVLYLIYCAYASRRSNDSINHDAHFFGALAGVMITIILNHEVIGNFLRQLGVG
ncbi:rhomboid family intramembrane serine protease [Mucilaginibacter sp. RS28]|uniref:Rhomboid family intramembrane serine protease n=1 Tax=Mucilaginibacter straminoryzae TaxID=2932774 RepID=A0A9X1X3T1_9SPHI|nr:rhomboid family intramembrane serine protease [Mucilaginibacter straminoryzae]MCJ8210431.1 rhomboid family intramembrane serine protease [Mucilaginibacter straminoryzae]